MESKIGLRILSTFDQLHRESLDLHTLFELVGGNPPAEREAVLDAVTDLAQRGLLREDGGGDFYRRTEDGRLALADPREVTFYTRDGCHLCDVAKAAITPLLAEYRAKLREVDIDRDPVLVARYNDDVPVIFLGQELFAQHRVDLELLRQRLERRKGIVR